MSKCNDYWCDYYGKGNTRCDSCEKKGNNNDRSDLRVILKRRADAQMELATTSNKKHEKAHGQER